MQRIQGESPFVLVTVVAKGKDVYNARCGPDDDGGNQPQWSKWNQNTLELMVPPLGKIQGKMELRFEVINAKKPRINAPMGQAVLELSSVLNECAGGKTRKERQWQYLQTHATHRRGPRPAPPRQ